VNVATEPSPTRPTFRLDASSPNSPAAPSTVIEPAPASAEATAKPVPLVTLHCVGSLFEVSTAPPVPTNKAGLVTVSENVAAAVSIELSIVPTRSKKPPASTAKVPEACSPETALKLPTVNVATEPSPTRPTFRLDASSPNSPAAPSTVIEPAPASAEATAKPVPLVTLHCVVSIELSIVPTRSKKPPALTAKVPEACSPETALMSVTAWPEPANAVWSLL